MLFDSPAYFLFLIPVVAVYWRLSHRAQNIFLLLASYFFYGWWDWRFLALMIGSTTMDFLIAQKIAPSRCDTNRKKWLIFSLVLNFSILGIFKYFNFFADSFSAALNTLGVHNVPLPLIRIILPPGISFYTFQEVAYIVDVYKGRLEPAKSFVEYGLFVSLFPHLIAGPIQRPGHLLPQVHKDRAFDADRFFDGLMLIFSGLIRKCVVADNCALLANMVLAGLWHGANWTFIIFGAIHGVVLAVERLLFPIATKADDAARPGAFAGFLSLWGQRILTFNVFCLSLAFFRAPSLSSATQFLSGLSNFAWQSEYASVFFMLSLFSIPLFVVDLLLEASNQEYPFATASYALRTGLAGVALIVLALFSGNTFHAFV